MSDFGRQSHLTEQSAVAILLLLLGTLANSAAGRVLYQKALTATQNDNGYVTMFFLLMPGLSALICFPLSRWIADLRFISGPGFFVGIALVTAPLVLLSLIARAGAAGPSRPVPERRGPALSGQRRAGGVGP